VQQYKRVKLLINAEKVINLHLAHNYTTLVIADHGNCETMINPTKYTHTTNPVPIILVDKDIRLIHDGVLGDIAPTILELLVEKPEVMTCHSLL
jgi:2,3-bisphosphoglycerate-independent phosphoglycerate mutase